jgi:hypothetical protein
MYNMYVYKYIHIYIYTYIYIYMYIHILQQVQSNAAGALHNLAVNDEEAQATLLKKQKYSI